MTRAIPVVALVAVVLASLVIWSTTHLSRLSTSEDSLSIAPNRTLNGPLDIVVATGTAGGLLTIRLDRDGGTVRTAVPLDIDCYITAVATDQEHRVFVYGVHSRGRLNSPGGLYEVDIDTGITSLLVSAEDLGGEAHNVFSGSCLEPSDTSRLVVVNTAGEIYRIDLGDEIKYELVATQSPGEGARWATVGRFVIARERSGILWAVDISKSVSSAAGEWFQVPNPLGIQDIARGHSCESLVAYIGSAWRKVTLSDSSGNFLPDPASLHIAITPGVASIRMSERDGVFVLAKSTDYPPSTVWVTEDWELRSSGFVAMDYVIMESDREVYD